MRFLNPIIPSKTHKWKNQILSSVYVVLLLFIPLCTNAQVQFDISDENIGCFGEEFTVDIEVENFEEITAIQLSFNWNPSKFAYLSTNSYNLPGLSASNFGTSMIGSGVLTFSWIDQMGAGVTLPDGSVIFTVTFDLIDPTGLPSDIVFSSNPVLIQVQSTGGPLNPTMLNGTIFNNDVDPPVILNCPVDSSVFIPVGCTTPVFWNQPLVFDDCDPMPAVSSNFNSGDIFSTGIYIITITAVDFSGNPSTCDFTVTVEGEPLTINCPPDITVKVPPGRMGAIVGGLAPTVTNNCAPENINYTLTGDTDGSGADDASGDFFMLGETNVTYTSSLTGTTCFSVVKVEQTDCVICNDTISMQFFDAGLPTGWSVTNEVGMDTLWRWTVNGKADLSGMAKHWNNRDSIGSMSGGGAMALASDGLDSEGIGFPHRGSLVSPFLDFSSEASVFLKFNQYYRNKQSRATVEVKNSTGVWTEVYNNDKVTAYVETSSRDAVAIDISYLVAGESDVQIRFRFDGEWFFWIIDDVIFTPCYPHPKTFPPYLGDSLVMCCTPFDVDDNGAPFVPNEIVVQWDPDPTFEKQPIRDSFGVISYTECCTYLEKWVIGDTITPVSLHPDSVASIGIKEIVRGRNVKTRIDEIDCNFYQWNNYLECCDPLPPGTLPTPPEKADSQIVVAILDTGIDYESEYFVDRLWKNENSNDCFDGDLFGWNFVDDSPFPYDDHCPSHGTHVAGIVTQTIEAHSKCPYRIMPVKICDHKGLSTVFTAGCGTYYAIDKGANVINDSWGMYNVPSPILKAAIDTALEHDIIVVAAAGNDNINLDGIHQQYPASYDSRNLITVASVDTIKSTPNGPNDFLYQLSEFSNYSDTSVHIGALGKDISSFVRGGGLDEKSGTSMAAPAVSAAVAIGYGCIDWDSIPDIKDFIIDKAWRQFDANNLSLQDSIIGGRILNLGVFDNCNSCGLTHVQQVSNNDGLLALIYPNPTNGGLFIEFLQNTYDDLNISISNMWGVPLVRQKIRNQFIGQSVEMDISDFPAGFYFVNIHQGEKTWSGKVIKH